MELNEQGEPIGTPTFIQAIDTQLLSKRLQQAKVGELVTYEDLDGIIGRDARAHGLQSALKDAQSRAGVVFQAIRNLGYRRLSDSEIIAKVSLTPKRVSRMAGRAIRTVETVKYEELDADDKFRFATSRTVLEVLKTGASARSIDRIASAVREADQKVISAGRAALIAFGSK